MYVMAKQVTINSTFFFLLFFPISDEPHGPLVLAIEPYQDQASGCPVTELDGKVAWVGTLQVHTPEVVVEVVESIVILKRLVTNLIVSKLKSQ